VTEGKEFADGSLIVGAPARAVRTLSPEQFQMLARLPGHYVAQKQRFQGGVRRIA
jgi:carbonic anhydrase/acetyltransferase-like protein (isoleucine patch superfamily)